MKLEHVYNTVQKAMTELESVDLVDVSKRKESQVKVNKVYDILDNFKDELIREKIEKDTSNPKILITKRGVG